MSFFNGDWLDGRSLNVHRTTLVEVAHNLPHILVCWTSDKLKAAWQQGPVTGSTDLLLNALSLRIESYKTWIKENRHPRSWKDIPVPRLPTFEQTLCMRFCLQYTSTPAAGCHCSQFHDASHDGHDGCHVSGRGLGKPRGGR